MRKRTRRKHYPLINPIQLAIKGAAFIEGDDLENLRKKNRQAIDAFFSGTATVHDWRTMADMHNLAETMSKGGVGIEVLEVCAEVAAALDDCHQRRARTGRIGMTGPQLQSLRALFDYYDLQVQSIARSEFERWIKLTADRIRSAHPDVKVFI